MKLRIAFKKTAIKLVQNGLCQFRILSGSPHIVFVAHLENHFIKRFFLLSIKNFFVVVFDAAVFAFLLGVEFCQSCIKQLMVCFLNGCVAVLNIQMGARRVYIFCEVGAAVMSNNSIAGPCADCSFYRFYLLNYGRIIGIPFAAAAAGFVTFVKSNAKALLTLRIKSALRSPRGNGECGFCGSLRRGLQVVPTLQNPRRDRQSFSNRICCNAAAHRQRRFGKSSLPSISNSADFSMGTGDTRGCVSQCFALSASNRSVARSCHSSQGGVVQR